ncbi:hypothetical protein [Candidatus Korobacter versatilis]|nr:hypothetical protein [Candidatus Koribacter versatilis]
METPKKSAPWLVVVILVVAFGLPIAIGTMEVRIARNAQAETAAVDYLNAVAKAENDYRKANDTFAAKLDDLKGLPASVGPYKIGYKKVTPDSYLAMAWPLQPGNHGRRYFFLDQTGVVRYELMKPAGPGSEPVPTAEKK